ncbi:unnamed protein product [Nippostrongylus brasiliensis]|uniref:Uncharacterized protein n=1 Tax=Nippostrongylus brasiliensis TaxID=27835 RepID=A0A158QWV2_NIPBR|nr:unnamed protein product [Nippostrongylus brasiliensis]
MRTVTGSFVVLFILFFKRQVIVDASENDARKSQTNVDWRSIIYSQSSGNALLHSLLYPSKTYPTYLAKQTDKQGKETGTILGVIVPIVPQGYQATISSSSKNSYHGQTCTLPDGGVTLFLLKTDQLVEDYTDGARTPLTNSCPSCGYGTELSYSPINPQYDLSDVKTGVILNLAVGGFQCKDNKNLCVHGTDGRRFAAASENAKIWPVPYCKGDVPYDIDKSTATYYDGNEYNYIEIDAITCAGCENEYTSCFYKSKNSGPQKPTASLATKNLEQTGYSYEMSSSHPEGDYGNNAVNPVEEQYSALGYGGNTQYIQPDGNIPYEEEEKEYNEDGSNGPTPLSDAVRSPAAFQAQVRLNQANRRLAQTRANLRRIRTQLAVTRARAQTALELARTRPAVRIGPITNNVKVNASPSQTNANRNDLASKQGNTQTSGAAPRLHSPVIEDNVILPSLVFDKSTNEMIRMGSATLHSSDEPMANELSDDIPQWQIIEEKSSNSPYRGTAGRMHFEIKSKRFNGAGAPSQQPSQQWISHNQS